MASQNPTPQDENAIDKVNMHLTEAGNKIANNKMVIMWIFVALIAACGLVLAYLFLYKNPQTDKAFEAYNKVQVDAMGNDSIAAAKYIEVANKYGGAAGNLAALSAGESLYNEGKYEEAIKYLKKFSSKDGVLEANALVLTGDCYVNLNKYDEAIGEYDKAIRKADRNPQIVPRILFKEANIYDAQKKYDKALECYTTVKNDYPEFRPGNGLDIDAYIERENARLGK